MVIFLECVLGEVTDSACMLKKWFSGCKTSFFHSKYLKIPQNTLKIPQNTSKYLKKYLKTPQNPQNILKMSPKTPQFTYKPPQFTYETPRYFASNPGSHARIPWTGRLAGRLTSRGAGLAVVDSIGRGTGSCVFWGVLWSDFDDFFCRNGFVASL
jgi:hypothetical protein